MLVEKKEDEMKTKKEKPPSLMTQQRARQTIPSIAAEQNIAIFCWKRPTFSVCELSRWATKDKHFFLLLILLSSIHFVCLLFFFSLGIINIPSIQGIRNITHRNTRKALEAKCLMECFVQQIIRVIKEPTFFYWLRIAYLLETYVKLFLMNIFHLMYRFPLHFTTHI